MARKPTGNPVGRPRKRRTGKRVQINLTDEAVAIVATWPPRSASAKVSALIVETTKEKT